MVRAMEHIEFADLSETILSVEHVFETDALIERLVCQNGGKHVLPRWRGKTKDAVAVSRRILKAAMSWGDPQTQFRIGQQKEYFGRLAKSADKAREAIDGFLLALGEGQQPLPKELQRQLEIQLQLVARSKGETIDGRDAKSQQKARNQCKALKIVRELAVVIGNESSRRRTETASRTHHVGKPEKRYFAHVLMVGWQFLTGNKPSHSNVRFLEFLTAAWQVACPAATGNEDWVQAIRGAAKMHFAGRVERIAERFPDWN